MSTKPKNENVTLLTGSEVPKKFYDTVLNQALVNSHKTVVGTVYLAEKILGADYWLRHMFNEDKTMAGRCIKDMADRGLIPYVFVSKRSDNKSTYKRN